jgi:spore photoproduct lyase
MKIKNLYIEEDVLKDEKAIRIQKKLRYENKIICKNYREVFNPKNQNFRIQKKEPSVILAKKKRNLILEAPKKFNIGFSENYYFSHMLNCIYDCNYCFLQGMFNSAHYVIFVNYDDFLLNIKDKLNNSSNNICFFSGYDCDSLALEDITGFIEYFVEKFVKLNNVTLEIRSKSTNIKSIKKYHPSNKIIPAFSLNPENSITLHEQNTPKLINRINAIKELQNLGWNIGIRFDPFIWYGEISKMSIFFEELFKSINKNRIHSVTIGNFRMTNSYLKRMVKIKPTDPYILEKQLLQILPSKNDDTEVKITNIKEKISEFIEDSKIFIN